MTRVAARARLRFVMLRYAQWRQEIAPLWHMEGSTRFISPLVNGYGQLQYAGAELVTRVRLMPLAAELDGERIAWTSVYNISDQALRLIIRPFSRRDVKDDQGKKSAEHRTATAQYNATPPAIQEHEGVRG